MDSTSDPMSINSFCIERVRKETADTFTFELESLNSGAGIPFSAGQFNMLYVFGIGEVPISISGDPTNPTPLVHTTRAVGTVTRMMNKLKQGDILGVRGPYGTHWPVKEFMGFDILIAAGGIGLAPLRPALYHILAHREKYGKVMLLYGTRSPEDIIFRRELEKWRARFDLEVYLTVDRATSAWRGNVGVVTTLIPKAAIDPLNTIAMICGPEIMMRYTALELQKHGVALESMFVSIERNMKCAIGFCGHCQFGPTFICKDGPVFPYSSLEELLAKWEI